MSARDVSVVGVGAVSPCGLDARQTALLLRAGKLEPRPTAWTGRSARRLACARSRALADAVSGDARRVELARLALEECCASIGAPPSRPVPLFLAWPVAAAGTTPSPLGAGPLAAIVEDPPLPIDVRRSALVTGGRTAFASAIQQALRCLETEGRDLVLVGAADTHHDEARLQALDDDLRLVAEDVGDGIIASEGAVVLALGAPHLGDALGRIRAVASGRDAEPTPEDEGISTGLCDVVRRVAAEAGSPTWWITDVRTERSSRKEHDFAAIRCRADLRRSAVTDLTEELGDCGVALGAHQVAFALMGFRLGFAPGREAIVTSTGDGALTAAIALEALA